MIRVFLIVIFLIYSLNAKTKSDFMLGIKYYKGDGVKRDLNRAVRYFERSAKDGNIKAKYNIAVIYGSKNYQNHNYSKAFDLFLELAKNGHAKAQNRVGMALLYGTGIDKDYKMAVRWFEESYFNGKYKPAGCSLALMYVMGKGVFVNLGRASKLAKDGIRYNLPLCKKVYNEFNLYKYKEDKGFKFGFYN